MKDGNSVVEYASDMRNVGGSIPPRPTKDVQKEGGLLTHPQVCAKWLATIPLRLELQ